MQYVKGSIVDLIKLPQVLERQERTMKDQLDKVFFKRLAHRVTSNFVRSEHGSHGNCHHNAFDRWVVRIEETAVHRHLTGAESVEPGYDQQVTLEIIKLD